MSSLRPEESGRTRRGNGRDGLLADGSVPAAAPGGNDTAKRRHVTAMFCDMVDSSPLVESLDPEDFRDVLHAYRHACVRAIERFGGYLAEYVGDGVVAFFGYPCAHEDDAHRAVHAALGILDELVGLNEDVADAIGRSNRVRIGLHTGVVVAGESDAGGLDVVGRTPHIAQRLEAIAPPGSIVISDDTFELIDGWFETESFGEKALKGVSGSVGVHRVVRATGALSRLEVTVGRAR